MRRTPAVSQQDAHADPDSSTGQAAAGARRRRSSRAHAAILRAAVELLEKDGYGALTMEAIAARAGASKATLYRWWPSKAAVVLEAYGAETARRIPPVDTGTLHGDLREFLRRLFASLALPGAAPTVRGLIAEAQIDPEFATAFRIDFMAGRRAAVRTLFERAIVRGELPPSVDLDYALDAFYGPVWYRLLLGHAPLDVAFLDQHAHGLMALFSRRTEAAPRRER